MGMGSTPLRPGTGSPFPKEGPVAWLEEADRRDALASTMRGTWPGMFEEAVARTLRRCAAYAALVEDDRDVWELAASMACETPAGDCDCAGCSLARSTNGEGA